MKQISDRFFEIAVYQVELNYLHKTRYFLRFLDVLAMDSNKTISLYELRKAVRILPNYMLYYPQGKVDRVREESKFMSVLLDKV